MGLPRSDGNWFPFLDALLNPRNEFLFRHAEAVSCDLHYFAILREDVCTCPKNPTCVRLVFELQIASDASQLVKRRTANVRPLWKKYAVGYSHGGTFGNELTHECAGFSED